MAAKRNTHKHIQKHAQKNQTNMTKVQLLDQYLCRAPTVKKYMDSN